MTRIIDLSFDELTARQIYDILRLRIEVFAIEQNVLYQDLNDRDYEKSTRHIWFGDKDRILSYLRVLFEPSESLIIGRVVTDAGERNKGYAGQLMDYVVNKYGNHKLEMHAQAYLKNYYARWGFVPVGPEFMEEERAHVAMERATK